MYTFLMIIHVFVSIVLILVILMQAGRGGGVSEIFGGSSTQTIFGTSATKFLTRATAACAVVFIITSLSLAVLSSKRSRSLMKSGTVQPIDIEQAAGREDARDVSQEDLMPTEEEPVAPESE